MDDVRPLKPSKAASRDPVDRMVWASNELFSWDETYAGDVQPLPRGVTYEVHRGPWPGERDVATRTRINPFVQACRKLPGEKKPKVLSLQEMVLHFGHGQKAPGMWVKNLVSVHANEHSILPMSRGAIEGLKDVLMFIAACEAVVHEGLEGRGNGVVSKELVRKAERDAQFALQSHLNYLKERIVKASPKECGIESCAEVLLTLAVLEQLPYTSVILRRDASDRAQKVRAALFASEGFGALLGSKGVEPLLRATKNLVEPDAGSSISPSERNIGYNVADAKTLEAFFSRIDFDATILRDCLESIAASLAGQTTN